MLFSLNGLYIGGGFPEDYAASIAQNPLLKDIAHLGAKGLPIYAECGGLMLLSRSLQIKDQRYAMAGLVPVDIEFCSKPQGLGYTEGCLVTDTPYYPKGTHLKGHEFHYSRLLSKNTLQKSDYVLALSRGRGMGEMDGCAYDGFVLRNVWASYTHIFAPAVPVWAASFTRLASRFTQDD